MDLSVSGASALRCCANLSTCRPQLAPQRALAVGIDAGVMATEWSQRHRDCRSTRCTRLPPSDHSGSARCTRGVRASQYHRLGDIIPSALQVVADSAMDSAFAGGCWQPQLTGPCAIPLTWIWVPPPPSPVTADYFRLFDSGLRVTADALGTPYSNGATSGGSEHLSPPSRAVTAASSSQAHRNNRSVQ